ncbi:MAG: patatin-like phospholipase family protein, partial [Leptospiraceae bacterium]|nr:patatin-like phospholipase family protein [Leptospiraceae bacterium]
MEAEEQESRAASDWLKINHSFKWHTIAVLRDVVEVFRHCGLIVFFLGFGAVLLLVVPQGIDAIRYLKDTEEGFESGRISLFLGSGIFWWSLQSWYGARAILALSDIRYVSYGRSVFFQKWIPRFFGLIPYLIMYLALDVSAPTNEAGELIYIYLYLGMLSIVYFLIVVLRRKFLKKGLNIEPLDIRAEAYDVYSNMRNWGFYWFSILFFVTLVLLIPFGGDATQSAMVSIGPVAIITLALGSWISLGYLVKLLTRVLDFPVGYIALTAFVVFSFLNYNHDMLLLPLDEQDKIELNQQPQYVKTEGLCNAEYDKFDNRRLLEDFEAWLRNQRQRNGYSARQPYPVLIVAIEGGGMRSGYYGAALLGAMHDELRAAHRNSLVIGMQSPGINLNEHIYAFSTVSGGSMAAATYVSEIHKRLREDIFLINAPSGESDAARSAQDQPVALRLKSRLRRDFLSPVTAFLAFPDMLQRFIPWGFESLDRSRALQRTWELAWESAESESPRSNAYNPFENRLMNLRIPERALYSTNASNPLKNLMLGVPALILNSTDVDTGSRVIISNLPRFGTDNPDGTDWLHPAARKRMPLSTAVLASARFPYITPSGRIPVVRRDPSADDMRAIKRAGIQELNKPLESNVLRFQDEEYGCAREAYLVDGGYFENSGIASALDLINELKRFHNSRLPYEITLVLIRTDANRKLKRSDFLREVLDPPQTFLNAWGARVPYQKRLATEFQEGLDIRQVIDFNFDISEKKVPSSWLLSANARRR